MSYVPVYDNELIQMSSFLPRPTEPKQKQKMSALRRRQLLLSYAPDWIITIALSAVFFSLDKVPGFKRQFSLADTSLRHTFAVHERVPDVALYFIAIVAPFVLQACINLLTIRSWWDFHNGTLGLILGLAITGSITQFSKITVGRPRPDIIDRCQPPAGSVDPAFGLSNATICTQTNVAMLRDGFRSFPSGHSSLSFAGLGFLAYYTAGKLHLFDKRGYAVRIFNLHFAARLIANILLIGKSVDFRHSFCGSCVSSNFAYDGLPPSLARRPSRIRPWHGRFVLRLPPVLPQTLFRTESSALFASHQT